MVLMKDSRSVSCGCRDDDDDDDDAPRVAAPQCIVNINKILSTLFADRKDDNYLSSKRRGVLLPRYYYHRRGWMTAPFAGERRAWAWAQSILQRSFWREI